MTAGITRPLALLLALGMLATACTRTPPGGEHVVGFGPSSSDATIDPATGAPLGEEGFASGGDVAGADGGASFGGGLGTSGGTGGGATTSGATTSGGPGGQGSTSTSGRGSSEVPTATGSGPGVEGRTVKIVFHHQLEACGDDPTTASQGVMSEKGRKVIDEYVRFFNEFVLADFGWTLAHEIVDDGGPFCPEKAQAAGLRIAKELRPFAALGSLVQPSRGPVLAEVITRAGILHVGQNWQTSDELRARVPLAWPMYPIAQRAFEDLVGYIDGRVKGTKTTDGSLGTEVDRSYGLLAVDTQEGRKLAGLIAANLRGIGVELAGTYIVSGDAGVAAQQASNTVLKMRQDGVNTLIFGMPYSAILTSIALTEAMNSQNYLPDILIGTYGVAFFDQLHNRRVWAKARGTSTAGAVALRVSVVTNSDGTTGVDPRFSEIAENTEGWIAAWKEKLGNNDNPQEESNPGAYDTWTQLSLLATGIIHAGDTLNAETFARGLNSAVSGGQNRCTVARLSGRDYVYNPTFDWDTDGEGGAEGFTTVYWVNQQTSFGTNGYYESEDNYRFFRTPAELPSQATHDTGQRAVDIPKQERIGIRPWTPCSQFPNFPG